MTGKIKCQHMGSSNGNSGHVRWHTSTNTQSTLETPYLKINAPHGFVAFHLIPCHFIPPCIRANTRAAATETVGSCTGTHTKPTSHPIVLAKPSQFSTYAHYKTMAAITNTPTLPYFQPDAER